MSPDPSPRVGATEPWRQLALAIVAGLLGLIVNLAAPTLASGLTLRLDVVIVVCVASRAVRQGRPWVRGDLDRV